MREQPRANPRRRRFRQTCKNSFEIFVLHLSPVVVFVATAYHAIVGAMATVRYALLALIVACTNAPPPQTVEDKQREVDAFRGEARTLIESQQERAYHAWADGQDAHLAETYRGHEKLYSVETTKKLLAVINQAQDADFSRAVRYLRRHLLSALTGHELVAWSDPIDALEDKATFSLDNQTYRYAELTSLLAKEPDAARRRRLYDAASPVADQLNTAHQTLDAKVTEVAHTLGFTDALELAGELRGIDVSTLEGTARALLDQTDAFYIATLHQVSASQLQLDADKLTPADNPRLLSTARFDASFPAEAELPTLQKTLAGMDLPLEHFPMVKLDGEVRPKKNPLPRTFAVLVPGDIRLTYEPKVGVIAAQNLFHELGLAIAYADSTTPWFEFKMLGSDSVRQAPGFLLQRLLSNPEWVKTYLVRLPSAEQKEYLRLQTLRQLFVARRYAAKILFELALHSGQANDPAKLYQNLLSRAYGYRVDEAAAQRWALDHDPLFESVPVFRAWLLEAMLDAKLEKTYGDRWFERKEVGRFLKDLWSSGEKPSAEEVAEQLGAKSIEPTAFVQRLKQRLR